MESQESCAVANSARVTQNGGMGFDKWGKKSAVCVNDSFYEAKRSRAINAEKGG